MKVRCKMCLVSITDHASHGGKPAKTFKFQPQYDQSIPEDQRFQAASPSGEFTIYVTNPAVVEHYKLGGFYYFDSEPVPEVAASAPTAA